MPRDHLSAVCPSCRRSSSGCGRVGRRNLGFVDGRLGHRKARPDGFSQVTLPVYYEKRKVPIKDRLRLHARAGTGLAERSASGFADLLADLAALDPRLRPHAERARMARLGHRLNGLEKLFRQRSELIYAHDARALARENGVAVPAWANATFDRQDSAIRKLMVDVPKGDFPRFLARELGYSGKGRGTSFSRHTERERNRSLSETVFAHVLNGAKATDAVRWAVAHFSVSDRVAWDAWRGSRCHDVWEDYCEKGARSSQ